MAKTVHILGAYEQLHPTNCLVEKARSLHESNTSIVIYGNKHL